MMAGVYFITAGVLLLRQAYAGVFKYYPFNYMIFNKSDYDRKKLKGYKSFEDYRLFYDGHVENLMFNAISDTSEVCLFKAEVKPTQRDKTYLDKNFYDLWFVLDKEDGSVVTGNCECIGGADGACRHLAAALYELEAFEMKSCTDGENQWAKRPCHHDVPVPVRNLNIILAKYHHMAKENNIKPHSDLFDPRHEQHRHPITDAEKRDFGLKIQEISKHAQCLDILLNPEDRCRPTEDCTTDIKNISVIDKAKAFLQKNDISDRNFDDKVTEFCGSIKITQNDICCVLEKTMGQSNNNEWHNLRKGLLTASNFGEACKYIEKDRQPSETFMKKIMGENRIEDSMLPPALKWGRKKEQIARIFYSRIMKKLHTCRSLKVNEVGLLLCEKYPALGCSIDGVAVCKCKSQHINKLVEIKCPYSLRDSNPKDVAIAKNCTLNKLTNEWEVTKACPYYSQIQGQLGLYNYTECDLVIYTNKGIHISTAKFDEEYFSDMVEKLDKFHSTYVVPRIFIDLLKSTNDV